MSQQTAEIKEEEVKHRDVEEEEDEDAGDESAAEEGGKPLTKKAKRMKRAVAALPALSGSTHSNPDVISTIMSAQHRVFGALKLEECAPEERSKARTHANPLSRQFMEVSDEYTLNSTHPLPGLSPLNSRATNLVYSTHTRRSPLMDRAIGRNGTRIPPNLSQSILAVLREGFPF